MKTITKADVVAKAAKVTGRSDLCCRQVVQAFMDECLAQLAKGNRLEFRDFGIFTVKKRAKRVTTNPATGKRITVPGRRVVTYKMGKALKTSLNSRRTTTRRKRRK